ncbi:unnamed protein product [Cylicostephanus goldi]|uniref:Uncharacterized protein n=1 Tax=Cylicostephanus goldi TaxID=71465 RepID=A0A3P6RT16_CYLGO|nr:unnamed protein product [Cylicostephanus goldi]
MFNLAGGLCLWMHNAPNFPGGHSNAIRSTAVISTFAAVCTVLLIAFYCLNVMKNPAWVEPSTHEVVALIKTKSRESSKPLTKRSTPPEMLEKKNEKQLLPESTQAATPQTPAKLTASPNYLPLAPAPPRLTTE